MLCSLQKPFSAPAEPPHAQLVRPKTRLVYLESVCRVRTLSLTGRLLLRLADAFVVQWDELRAKAPGAAARHYFYVTA